MFMVFWHKIKISEILFAEMLLLLKQKSDLSHAGAEGEVYGHVIQDNIANLYDDRLPCNEGVTLSDVSC